MRRAFAVLLLGAVVVLSGCDVLGLGFVVPSLHPFYTDGDAVFDTALVGPWEQRQCEGKIPSPGPPQVWTFKRSEGTGDGEAGPYDLTVSIGDYEASFEAHLAKIGDALFLDLFPGELQTPQFRPGADEPRPPEEDAGDDVMLLYFLHCLPAHSVWRVRLTGDELRLDPLDVDWLAGEVQEETLGLRFEEVSDRQVLTASRAELRQFLEQHAQDDKAFAGGFTYTRQNSPRPEPEKEEPVPAGAGTPAEPSRHNPGPVLDQRLKPYDHRQIVGVASA